jgi:hypothetical protein
LHFKSTTVFVTIGKTLYFEADTSSGKPYVVLQDSDDTILSTGSLPLSYKLADAVDGSPACQTYKLIEGCSGTSACAAGIKIYGGELIK